jgi:hypothetical protein
MTTESIEFKYREDEIIAELYDYIASTYSGHYVGEKDKIQTFDVYDALGSLATTSRDTAIKYLMRYGKKDGHNRKDLLKALHYTIILFHKTQETVGVEDTDDLQQSQSEFDLRAQDEIKKRYAAFDEWCGSLNRPDGPPILCGGIKPHTSLHFEFDESDPTYMKCTKTEGDVVSPWPEGSVPCAENNVIKMPDNRDKDPS